MNAALQPWVEQRRKEILEQQAQAIHRRRVEGVLAWREYAFCLYPESTLHKFLAASSQDAGKMI